MKRLFLSFVLLTSAVFMMAEDLKYLNVESNGGTEESIELSTVQKITFTDTQVIVHTSTGEMAFPLSEMEKMSFTATSNAIDVLPLQTEGLQFLQGRLITSGKACSASTMPTACSCKWPTSARKKPLSALRTCHRECILSALANSPSS